jgi:hypothetical protein
MKRMLLAAATSSMLALAAPSLASAHHHAKCHARHHACAHARHARLLSFGAPISTTTSTTTTAPTTPTTPTGGETAGNVASFEGGVLTITLNDGSKVSGKVTEQTEIRCQSATPPTEGSDDDENGDESSGGNGEDSSHSGPGLGSTGDDMSSGDSGDGDGQQTQTACTSAALVPGAVVREAELSVGSGGAVWEHIDLIQ